MEADDTEAEDAQGGRVEPPDVDVGEGDALIPEGDASDVAAEDVIEASDGDEGPSDVDVEEVTQDVSEEDTSEADAEDTADDDTADTERRPSGPPALGAPCTGVCAPGWSAYLSLTERRVRNLPEGACSPCEIDEDRPTSGQRA